jgi:hypothetical protein
VPEPAQERHHNAAFGCTLLLFFRVVLAGFDLFDLSWGTPMRLIQRYPTQALAAKLLAPTKPLSALRGDLENAGHCVVVKGKEHL